MNIFCFRIFLPTESDICLAVGVDKHYKSKNIFIRPLLDCDKCRRCFIEDKPSYCAVSTLSRVFLMVKRKQILKEEAKKRKRKFETTFIVLWEMF